MHFEPSILPIILAGLMNGSFVIPARYIKNVPSEKIWLCYSLIGLIIIPWLLIAIFLPNALQNYSNLSPDILAFLLVSGAIFGLGQLCFASAFNYIGIALSFVINLGVGVTLGSMFVVFYHDAFWSYRGYLVSVAILLIIASLIISYFANRDKTEKVSRHYQYGWLLALLAGIASGLQNIAFVIVLAHSPQIQTNPFWVWPPFLFVAALIMLIGFFYKFQKMQYINAGIKYAKGLTVKNITLISLMGIFFTGSLALYSVGMGKLDQQQQIIGWPALLVSIILTSQIWGWIFKEISFDKKVLYKIVSIMMLVIAVVILGFSA